MKVLVKIFLLVLLPVFAMGQNLNIDSLKQALKNAPNDSVAFNLNSQLADYYSELNRDTALYYMEKCLILSQKNNKKLNEAIILSDKGYEFLHLGKFSESYECLIQAFKISENPLNEGKIFEFYSEWGFNPEWTPHQQRLCFLALTHLNYGHLMGRMGKTDQLIFHYNETIKISETIGDTVKLGLVKMSLGRLYFNQGKLDLALALEQYAERMFIETNHRINLGTVYRYLGEIFLAQHKNALAVQYFHKGNEEAMKQNNQKTVLGRNYYSLTKFYLRTEKNRDSSLYYALKMLDVLKSMGSEDLADAYSNLSESYALNNKQDSAFKYKKLAFSSLDSISKFKIESLTKAQTLAFDDQLKLKALEKEKADKENLYKLYILVSGLGIMFLIGFLLYRNNRQKQKANTKLQTTLTDLKTAQTELEGKNREAEIEVAIERVRSKAMAMHKSSELITVVKTLRDEMASISFIKFSGLAFITQVDDSGYNLWLASKIFPYDSEHFVPYIPHKLIDGILKDWSTRPCFIIENLTFEEKNSLMRHYFENTIQKNIPEERKKYILDSKGMALSISYQNNFVLQIWNWDGVPFSDEENASILRFAVVFEQSYIRFLELQKAEALAEQARLDLIQIQTEKSRAEEALKILKSTQAQLIQSEKLASLGELTAGIAHEIQNPLNFVNNFSKFSIGIAQELNTELNQPEVDKKYVGELLKDLTSNQEKISFHGDRAASIVTGMLEHSRTSTGAKGSTDINKLCDEYFRLASNSWRAKNKDFNIEMITHFDESLPKIEIVPQDIGRVIVNLINNAFYAVNEGYKNSNLIGASHIIGLTTEINKPIVTVETSQTASHIQIRIKDNGTGMTDAVKEKVFQPFFTTKPTGSGTGLGLSLAYDIITKGHGGTLKVESVEGVGSEFVIFLPIKN